jgi:hypothetical protein
MNPNFQNTKTIQSNAIRALEQENQYLRAQAQAMSQTTRLIEAAVTGLCHKYTDPQEIAKKAVEVAGAVIMELEGLSKTDG